MFATKEMSKVHLFAAQSDLAAIIDTLHGLRACHLVKSKLDRGSPLSLAEPVAERLNKLNTVLSVLGLTPKRTAFEKRKLALDAVLSEVDSLHAKAVQLDEQLSAARERLHTAEERLSVLSPFAKAPVFSWKPQDLMLRSATTLFGTVKQPEAFAREVAQLKMPHELWQDGPFVILTYVHTDKAEQYLKGAFTRLNLDFVGERTFAEAHAALGKEREEAAAEAGRLEEEISTMAKKPSGLYALHSFLSVTLEKQQAPLQFRMTKNAFMIEAYVESDRVARLKTELDQKVTKNYHLVEEPVSRHENAPVKLDHGRTVSPFQFFMDLYTLPSYGEIDPTLITFVTFPLIFGAILGDIGYGLATMVIFLILRAKMPQFKAFFNILLWSAFWTILFGFLFGEFFGATEILGIALPHLIERLSQVNELLTFSIVIGLLHINLGLVLGFINEYRHHGFMHAFLAKISWIILQAGAGLLYFSFTGSPTLLWPGVIIAAIGVVLIGMGEGVKGLVELPGIFGNILSYARIMAIGLASAALAEVVNEFATQFFSEGMGGILPAILILLIGHAINLLLGLLGPFLHALRLHYVEHYGKFFEGGGERYMPFGEPTTEV